VMILMTDSASEAVASVVRRVMDSWRDVPPDAAGCVVEASYALFPDHAAEPSDLPRAVRARGAMAVPSDDLAPRPPV
jgi:hypothetical protein